MNYGYYLSLENEQTVLIERTDVIVPNTHLSCLLHHVLLVDPLGAQGLNHTKLVHMCQEKLTHVVNSLLTHIYIHL